MFAADDEWRRGRRARGSGQPARHSLLSPLIPSADSQMEIYLEAFALSPRVAPEAEPAKLHITRQAVRDLRASFELLCCLVVRLEPAVLHMSELRAVRARRPSLLHGKGPKGLAFTNWSCSRGVLFPCLWFIREIQMTCRKELKETFINAIRLNEKPLICHRERIAKPL